MKLEKILTVEITPTTPFDFDSTFIILVDFSETQSFFELGRIQEKFEDLFNKPIDLVIRKNIKEGLKNTILQETETFYEKRCKNCH